MLQFLKGKVLLFLFLLLTASIFIFISCRRSLDLRLDDSVEKKFFDVPANASPAAKAIAASFKKQNNEKHFVKDLVKRAGYPRWNKTMEFKPKSASRSGRSQTGYSAEVIYIPFVQDNENFTNASLIVRMDPADTAFQMLYDRQYTAFGFDSTGTGEWNARNIFHIFARFDHALFGHRAFNITDGRIFGFDSADHYQAILMMDGAAANSSGRTADDSYNDVDCVPIYTRIPCPPYAKNATEPVCFDVVVSCTSYGVPDPSSGGGGTGGDGGSGGGGSTGGSGDGNWYDDPCNNGTDPTPRSLPNTDPCGNGSGWEPVETLPNQHIIDSLEGYPCAQEILAILPNLNNTTKSILQNSFGVSENFNIIFRADTTMPNYENGATKSVQKNIATNTYDINIRLNSNMLKNSSKEFILNVMFHESIHAFMNYQWFLYNTNQIDSNTFKAQFPQIWNYKNGSNSQHIQISETYISHLKQTVLDFNSIADTSIARAISWVGLQATPAWINLGNDTLDIRQKASIAKYGTVTQMSLYNLKKCN